MRGSDLYGLLPKYGGRYGSRDSTAGDRLDLVVESSAYDVSRFARPLAMLGASAALGFGQAWAIKTWMSCTTAIR